MQPSKERETTNDDPLDGLDDLLDDDLASGRDTAPSREIQAESDDVRMDDGSKGSDRARIGMKGRWFSLQWFVLSLVVIAGAVFLGGSIPLVGGTIGHAVGVFLGAFLLGVVRSASSYVETGLAGTGIGASSALLSVLGIGFLPIGLSYVQQWGLALLAIGGGIGLLLAFVGHYFGQDLRAGLTEDVPS